MTYEASSRAPVEEAWSLIARPGRWHEWAPHVRGAWGLGDPEVKVGARGAARLLGAVPVPAVVTAKDPGRSWTWEVGPVSLVHSVTPLGSGCEVAVEISAPGPLETVLGVSYGPLVGLLVRRLARVAEAA
ncbi:MAG: SRPBCC family protein [Actinomycetota bacterium]|nr:SRPBCC family protein [Actinomycetota bacterium]